MCRICSLRLSVPQETAGGNAPDRGFPRLFRRGNRATKSEPARHDPRLPREAEWYRNFVQAEGEKELPFVGSATIETPPESAASRIRETLGFDIAARKQRRTRAEALRLLIRNTEEASILVMVSGVVMSNNQRQIDPKEFRGFALSDPLAPLVFINGADTKAAQMFTLAHELGHIWLGNSALSNMDAPPGSGFKCQEV